MEWVLAGMSKCEGEEGIQDDRWRVSRSDVIMIVLEERQGRHLGLAKLIWGVVVDKSQPSRGFHTRRENK